MCNQASAALIGKFSYVARGAIDEQYVSCHCLNKNHVMELYFRIQERELRSNGLGSDHYKRNTLGGRIHSKCGGAVHVPT